MTQLLDERLGRAVARLVTRAGRHPVLVLALALAAAAASAVIVVRDLGIQGGTEEMLSPELPFRRHWDEFRAAFPATFDPFYVVVEADSADRARHVAEGLAERLRADPARFAHVYLPGGGAFFEQHGLLYLEPGELYDLADHLADVQPYIGELARDTSLRGLFGLLATGVDAAREGDATVLDLARVFDRLSDGIDRALAGGGEPVSWDRLILGDAASEGTFRVLVVSPVFDYSDIQPQRAAMLGLRETIRELGVDARPGVRVRITGDPALEYEEIETARREATRAGLISFVLVTAILFLALRRARLVIATIVTLLIGLVLTAAFAALTVGHLNPISVAFAVLFVGLSVDFGIHLCVRYRELVAGGRPHADALGETAHGVGSSLCLCSLTTAIGFWAFVPTAFSGVAQLGLIAGGGMLISLACSLTVMPAWIGLRPLRGGAPPAPARGARARVWLLSFPSRHARAVRLFALALGLGSLALLPRARFDHNPLRLRAPGSDSVTAFNDLLERAMSSPWRMNVLAADPEAADAVAERLRRLETVEEALTLRDYVPADQERKLEILGEIALFLGPLKLDGASAPPRPGETLDAMRAFERAADSLVREGGPPELVASARRLREASRALRERLPAGDAREAQLAAVEASLLGDLRAGLVRLQRSLEAGPVGVGDLPPDLLAATVSDDERIRVEAFPREDLNQDDEALARFVDSVREVTPKATGTAAIILESARAVVRAFRQALLSAVAAITALLFLLWRRLRDTALVLAPLLLASSLTAAATVLLDMPFNFANVIVIPLLLGMGVDSGIHLVHRSRTAPPADGNLLGTSTARAVLFSTLTTMASFGSLGLSAHPGMASMGQLLCIGIALVLACNLIVLPALLAGRGAPDARAQPAS